MKFLILIFGFTLCFSTMKATVWQVGASRQYTKPSQVSSLVKSNDTVSIDAGIYTADVAHWTASNLLLQGVGGMAHLKSEGQSWGKKAIWVIGGENTRVAFIEFSECTVPDGNGAGIRLEAANLTVHGCYFHDNEDGILAGDNQSSDIVIEYCEFSHNGKGDGLSHNLYINHVRSLTFQYNYSHHAKIGHELKSRAHTNYILYNRISNETDGTASREIDLPNGGLAVIMGNEIQQGIESENSNIIGYGQEGLTNPTSHQLYIVNNTIVNERGAGSFLTVKDGTAECYAHNNIFAGTGTVILGSPIVLDTSHNWNGTIAAANFVDSKTYNYSLLQTSPAVNRGEGIVKKVNDFSLIPTNEYRHPANLTFRITKGAIDIGAHENTSSLSVEESKALPTSFVYPNPTSGNCTITIPEILKDNPTIEIFDVTGKQLKCYENVSGSITVDVSQFPTSGIYWVKMSAGFISQNQQLIINK